MRGANFVTAGLTRQRCKRGGELSPRIGERGNGSFDTVAHDVNRNQRIGHRRSARPRGLTGHRNRCSGGGDRDRCLHGGRPRCDDLDWCADQDVVVLQCLGDASIGVRLHHDVIASRVLGETALQALLKELSRRQRGAEGVSPDEHATERERIGAQVNLGQEI